MIEELFSQIDFNGDGTVDWDEFTTFTIALSVASAESKYKVRPTYPPAQQQQPSPLTRP